MPGVSEGDVVGQGSQPLFCARTTGGRTAASGRTGGGHSAHPRAAGGACGLFNYGILCQPSRARICAPRTRRASHLPGRDGDCLLAG
jgi:hypothetical protein